MASRNHADGDTALFVTCLVDLMRPQVGHAVVRILQHLAIDIVVPPQVCCGQPNYNVGDRDGARAIARSTLRIFEPYAKVLIPSGSCAGMIIRHYSTLFTPDDPDHGRARDLAARTEELVSFLAMQKDLRFKPDAEPERVIYHDACAGLRELGVKDAPRQLLAQMPHIELRELQRPEVCCGFGGAFSLKHPEISGRMVDDKIADIVETEAELLVSGDLGCLLNIEGRLIRQNLRVRTEHIAETLARSLDPAGPGR